MTRPPVQYAAVPAPPKWANRLLIVLAVIVVPLAVLAFLYVVWVVWVLVLVVTGNGAIY